MHFCKISAFAALQDQHNNGEIPKTTVRPSVGENRSHSLSVWCRPGHQAIQKVKLVALLLLAFCFVARAEGRPPKITLSLKNAPIKKVFESIKQQSDYLFVYNEAQLHRSKPVTIQVKDVEVEEALQLCFKDQPFTYAIVDKVIVVKEKANNLSIQEETATGLIDVKGRVVNEKGEPIAGVTVNIKGSSIATYTDANGEFVLGSVDKDAVLEFTSINMEPFQLKVSGRQELFVSLKTKITALGDVIVTVSTGYEDIPKERATGSFVKIDNQTLNQQVGTNILQRLDGVASGVLFEKNKSNGRPNSSLNISIRGLSTINGPLDPLVVLDGFIYEGDISNINPNDVENVTILKDAAAASIWGARAGNGVIVITTKKGKFNQKLQVGFNTNITITEKPDLFYLPQMKSGDYVDVEQMLFNNGYFDFQAGTGYIGLTPAVEVFLKRKNGLISETDSASQINALKGMDSRDQYNKYIYRNAVTQQYSLNIRGGSSVNAYAFSVAYDRNRNELDNKQQKINIHFENIYQPIDRLKVGLGVYYTNSKTKSGMPGFNDVQINGRQVPYLKLADESGNSLAVPVNYRSSYTDTAGAGKLLDWRYYPLENYKHTWTGTNLQELYSNISLQYKIIKPLDIDIKYQYQKQETVADQVSDQESYEARNLINLFSQLNRETGVVTRMVPLGGIRTLNNTTIESHTIRGQLNFNQSWGDHAVSAIAGNEIRQAKTIANGNITYGYNSNPVSFSTVDFVNPYPTFVTGDYQTIPPYLSFTDRVYRFVSYYANASYTFQNRYIFSASARRDGANIFGVNTNDKWKPLWSVGLGWKISDEPFYRSGILPQLKLRATYGYNGNVDVSKTALAVGGYFPGAPRTNFPYVRIQTVNNPDLRWEQNRTINLALDFAFKNDVISGSLEYYLKEGRDLYGLTPYDYTTTGRGGEILKNIANTRGYGFDVVLNSRNINKGIKWNTTLLLNYNVSKTTKYFSSTSNDLRLKLGGGTAISPVIGEPLYSISAYKWGGLDNMGNPQGVVKGQKSVDYSDLSLNGEVVSVGPSTPTTFGSLINSFQWKNLSFSANISFKLGYYFQKSSISYTALVDNGVGHKDFENRWQKTGDEAITNIPSFIYPADGGRDAFYLNSEVNVLKADNIRLNYVNLSYSLGILNKKNWPFKDIKVYVNAANLGILWRANKEGLDPDYPYSLPASRSYSFGLTSNF